MKKLQKWISLILVLVMLISTMPMAMAGKNDLPEDREDQGIVTPDPGTGETPGHGGNDNNDLPADRNEHEIALSETGSQIAVCVRTGVPVLAMVAVYDRNGKFVQCEQKSLMPGETSWTVERADLLRVFLLDDSYAPLCAPAEYSAK